jgi:cell fate regulator YaaT (PSP1 superfamily)
MIAPTDDTCDIPELEERAPEFLVLARYGRVPQVARFAAWGERPERNSCVVVSTDRGQELAMVLQTLPVQARTADGELATPTGELLRQASADDIDRNLRDQLEAEESFPAWSARAESWKLQLELIDIERTLDDRLILYVLNDRSAETTRLALLAAAGGFGVIHVQPVSAEGIVQTGGGGGCGTCSK